MALPFSNVPYQSLRVRFGYPLSSRNPCLAGNVAWYLIRRVSITIDVTDGGTRPSMLARNIADNHSQSLVVRYAGKPCTLSLRLLDGQVGVYRLPLADSAPRQKRASTIGLPQHTLPSSSQGLADLVYARSVMAF